MARVRKVLENNNSFDLEVVTHHIEDSLQKLCNGENTQSYDEDFYFDDSNGRRRYVQTIKIHAVISERTITNVFDTISSYYLEVMNEIYNDDTIENYTNDFLDIMKGSADTEFYNIPSAFKAACKVFENVMFDCISNTLYNMNSQKVSCTYLDIKNL